MEMWTDIPQQVWEASITCWFIYFLSVVCCAVYMIINRHKSTEVAERRSLLMDGMFWMFIIPFIITFGFALVLFDGIGVLVVVVDYHGH